jgi:2-polyprenyl-3-methyl-5-hydroxy-6-metoxy-1,4-benzoquinol methylase
MDDFKIKLDEIANNSLYATFTNSMTIEYSYSIFNRYFKMGTYLELGPAEGLMTNNLIKNCYSLTVIEGSTVFANHLKTKYPQINVINSLFEDAVINEKFDNIVLGHVLEHVSDPSIVLQKVLSWLKPSGVVLCSVPNARSIHRQVAVEMGLIPSIFAMSEKDVHHGHTHIYTPETLREIFLSNGFKIISTGGYWLKPISDSQIEQSWNENMLSAFMKLGEFYPDIAAEIYVIATHDNHIQNTCD